MLGCALLGSRQEARNETYQHVTNVRNLASPFWRSMLVNPERRCLVPSSAFAEPKIGAGRKRNIGFG